MQKEDRLITALEMTKMKCKDNLEELYKMCGVNIELIAFIDKQIEYIKRVKNL